MIRLWRWFRNRLRRRSAPTNIDPPATEEREIVAPTCGQCGALVWENATHGHRFCAQGHQEPEIVYVPIDEIHLSDHNAQGDDHA